MIEAKDEDARWELDAFLKVLEATMRRDLERPDEHRKIEAELPAKWDLGNVARRERWPPRDNEEKVPTPSSAEIEAEEKKVRTDTMSIDEDSAGINMVYTLPMSFKAIKPQEDADEKTSDDEGLPVAELQLT